MLTQLHRNEKARRRSKFGDRDAATRDKCAIALRSRKLIEFGQERHSQNSTVDCCVQIGAS